MKQVIVVRSDLDMGMGKTAAQCAHASLLAYRDADKQARNNWDSGGAKKVVVYVESEEELLAVNREAESRGLPVSLVRDAGHTEIEPGTLTAVGVGPGRDEEVDGVTGELPLL